MNAKDVLEILIQAPIDLLKLEFETLAGLANLGLLIVIANAATPRIQSSRHLYYIAWLALISVLMLVPCAVVIKFTRLLEP